MENIVQVPCNLVHMADRALTVPTSEMSVGRLERQLLGQFPAQDAEDWDATGLLVGDPARRVEKVAVALDVTAQAIALAQSLGANVLLTHHPAYLKAPEKIIGISGAGAGTGTLVYEAVSKGIALMNFHTALDVSPEAQTVLPRMLGLEFEDVLCKRSGLNGRGYGQRCGYRSPQDVLTVGQMAARCTSAFGRPPRVWGDFSRKAKKVATFNGAVGDLISADVARGIDCLICGEIKYHVALNLAQNGLAVIELGHDVSELPYCMTLAAACKKAGIEESDIIIIDQSQNWMHPEAVRI